jgi:hypothetical protein
MDDQMLVDVIHRGMIAHPAIGLSLGISLSLSAVPIKLPLIDASVPPFGVKCFSMSAAGNRSREEIDMANTKL